jgi:hypothetical protein
MKALMVEPGLRASASRTSIGVLLRALWSVGMPGEAHPQSSSDPDLQRIIALYRGGDFANAIAESEGVGQRGITANKDRAVWHLYRGLAYFILGDSATAANEFRAAVIADESLVSSAADHSPFRIRAYEDARTYVEATIARRAEDERRLLARQRLKYGEGTYLFNRTDDGRTSWAGSQVEASSDWSWTDLDFRLELTPRPTGGVDAIYTVASVSSSAKDYTADIGIPVRLELAEDGHQLSSSHPLGTDPDSYLGTFNFLLPSLPPSLP